MTIPHGDPRGLHSVSDRRKVTFANEGATAHAPDSKPEDDEDLTREDSNLLVNSSSNAVRKEGEGIIAGGREGGVEEGREALSINAAREESVDVVTRKGKPEVRTTETTDGVNLVSEACLSHYVTQDKIAIEESHLTRNEPEATPRDLRKSSLPLLDLPTCSDLSRIPDFNTQHDRKLSLNLPYSNRPAQTKKPASGPPPVSSSSSNSGSRKVRRKSLPQRLGLRYQKIPQEDFSPSDLSPSENPPGNLNLACATSPSPSSPTTSATQDSSDNRPNLSVHNAEVHASFHKESNPTSGPSGSGIGIGSGSTHLESLVRLHSALDAEGSKDKKKKQASLFPDPNNKSKNKKNPNLSRVVSASSKSLDLAGLHTGRGHQPDKRKSKKPGRSVSTEDLAGLRIHRAGRAAADPHPSPGSPSHCCLVSVARVPNMAAATSHLTLDSEYQTVRLAVLGAPGVGKSAIVKQFVMQQFLEEYVPTEQRQVFCPAVIINEHLYEVRIIDCPYIPYFPVNSLYEWTDFRGYGLRNATAYVLVYDITSEESFEYIKSLRLQILESRNRHDVPIFVVGNKHDLADERGVSRREVANLVKKQWKCGYIECSAKYNWHIMLLFKELMKTIDYIDYGHKPTSMRVQDALRRNRCLIL